MLPNMLACFLAGRGFAVLASCLSRLFRLATPRFSQSCIGDRGGEEACRGAGGCKGVQGVEEEEEEGERQGKGGMVRVVVVVGMWVMLVWEAMPGVDYHELSPFRALAQQVSMWW